MSGNFNKFASCLILGSSVSVANHAQSLSFVEIPASVYGDNLNIFSEEALTFSQPMAVSNSGVVAFQDETHVYSWSYYDGLMQLGAKTDHQGTFDISNDGSIVMTSHQLGAAYPVIYQNGEVRQVNFNADALSGNGERLGGRNGEMFYSPMSYDLTTDTPISHGSGSTYRISDLSTDGSLKLQHNNSWNSPPAKTSYIIGRGASVPIAQNFGEGRLDLSGDGQTVIGRYGVCADMPVTCSRAWSADKGSVELGPYLHRGVNHDATKAVGVGYVPKEVDWFGSPRTMYFPDYGAYWDSQNGLQDIVTMLEAAGVDMSGWSAIRLSAISDDGNYVVGYGTNPEGLNRAFFISFKEPVCAPY